MGLFTILKGLLGLAGAIANYIKDKQLIDAGQAIAISNTLKEANEQIVKADNARRNVDVSRVHDDPNNRDNPK